ncbi:DUF5688 family protein [Pseudobutyrivibrio sp.]|uniref:DUF5688 family protein n=1 Tax=Pseudobutyrivibrio sp. TaxID=2014367 RepID=UPI0025E46D36|nr:DUF5688 family protein [Pseudobutyrivibrio sp.]MBR5649756.1 hypothetical protein [Pseudobutyrivibrio sp.]
MLNYEQFKEQFKDDLKKSLEAEGYKIERIDVIPNAKLQHGEYDAITVRLEDSMVGPSGNLENFFDIYEKSNGNYDTVLGHVTEKFADAIENVPGYDVNQLKDYEFIKDKLVLDVVNAKKNEAILNEIPHKKLADLAVVYRAQLGRDGDGIATVLINNMMLEAMGVTPEQLHKDAVAIAPEIRPVEVNTLMGEIIELTGAEIPGLEVGGPEEQILVGTVRDKMHGACVLAYPDFLDNMASQNGGSFYIIPSSIHEVLMVPESLGTDPKALQEMIETVNATELRPEDILSDKLYHYDANERLFELADDYEKRQAKKEHKQERESAVKKLKDKELAKAKEPKREIKPKVKDRAEQVI